MRPCAWTEQHRHLENWSFCTNVFWLPPTFHLRGLCLEFAQLLSRVLFRPSSKLTQLLINAFQSPLLPPPGHHPHPHMLLPSHRPSWLSPFTPTAWNPQLDASAALSAWALRFLSPNMALQLLSKMPYLSCCSLPAYLSISFVSYNLGNWPVPSVLRQQKLVLSSLHCSTDRVSHRVWSSWVTNSWIQPLSGRNQTLQ